MSLNEEIHGIQQDLKDIVVAKPHREISLLASDEVKPF
jgi:hypothetical protein